MSTKQSKSFLTSSSLRDYDAYFKGWGIPLNLAEDFFVNLAELIVDENQKSFIKRIEKLVRNVDFQSMEDANRFLNKYTDFTTDVIAFIEALEQTKSQTRSNALINDVFDALAGIAADNKKPFGPMIHTYGKRIMNIIFKKYGVRDENNLNLLRETIAKKTDEKVADFIITIVLVLGRIKTLGRSMSAEDLRLPFKGIVILVMRMNILRKYEYVIEQALQEEYEKALSEDPCPCGSGLKYKKCCLEKAR